MGWLLLGLYVIAAAALVVGLYNYVSIQELNKSHKFNSQYIRKLENKLGNLEKIADNKKWRWK
jgi:CHASE3 domain sensor protein